jgi:hypothetical protein
MRAVIVLGICDIRCAESRDLDDVTPEAHVSQAKPPADQAAVAEQIVNLIRIRVRDDVEILRVPVEQ